MTFERTVALSPDEVVTRAKAFFTRRIPAQAAFVEREGPGLLVLRGQGGEEIVFAAIAAPGGSSVRGSTMLFGQQINRFFTTLPPAPMTAVGVS
ncbi:MAG TPA: hypothetical protein VGI92_05720 [Gemmatimonadales bacterium]|jgi:hypothetical protein